MTTPRQNPPLSPEAAPESMQLPLTRQRLLLLLVFSAATVLILPLRVRGGIGWPAGIMAWVLALALCLRDGNPALRRRMGMLLGCIAVLAMAPIDTDTRSIKFLTLGAPFLACIVLPSLILRRSDPGVIRYRLWPRRLRWLDLFYVAIAFPLAYWILKFYFHVNPYMPWQWPLPAEPESRAMTRLFWGINGVGVWDELFFVNTVYAVLRSLFAFRVANLVQAVVYTSVLTTMAFTGIGPALVYLFALTQGSMFEKSENLLYVLVVHLIVDYFLYWQIVMGHFPGYVKLGFMH